MHLHDGGMNLSDLSCPVQAEPAGSIDLDAGSQEVLALLSSQGNSQGRISSKQGGAPIQPPVHKAGPLPQKVRTQMYAQLSKHANHLRHALRHGKPSRGATVSGGRTFAC